MSRPSKLIVIAVTAFALACTGSPNSPSQRSATGTAFKVATWNIRSGMGIRGFNTTEWSHETTNCTDRSKPINAWAIGLPQAELERIAADSGIVAMAVQEAWNCASTSAINSILGFKSVSREFEGVALRLRLQLLRERERITAKTALRIGKANTRFDTKPTR